MKGLQGNVLSLYDADGQHHYIDVANIRDVTAEYSGNDVRRGLLHLYVGEDIHCALSDEDIIQSALGTIPTMLIYTAHSV